MNFGDLQAQCGRDNVYDYNKYVKDTKKDPVTRNATIQCPYFPITASFFLSVCRDMITAWNKEEVWTASEGKYTTEHRKCGNDKARGLDMIDKNKQGFVKGWATLVEMPAVATASAVTWGAGGGQRWYYGDIPAPWAASDMHYDETHTHLKAPAIPDRKRGTIVSCLSSLTATMPDNGFILISKMGPVL